MARIWRFADCRRLSQAEADEWLSDRLVDCPSGVGALRPTLSENLHCAVDRIKALISDGDCYQVNFTFPLHFEWFGSPLALYARLREQQPVR